MPYPFFKMTCILALSMLLTACYAQEMHVEDPIFNYQEERLKTMVLLPLAWPEQQTEEQAPFAKTLQAAWTMGLGELPSVQLFTKPILLTQLEPQKPALQQGIAEPNFSAIAPEVDIVTTSQYRLHYYRGAAPGSTPLTSQALTELSQSAQKKGVYLELFWQVKFWDTHNNRLIFEHQDTLGDMALIQDRRKLEQALAEQAVRNLIYRLKPYYIYR